MSYIHDKPEGQVGETRVPEICGHRACVGGCHFGLPCPHNRVAPASLIEETPTPETYLARDLPLWCRRVDGRYPENDEQLAELFREARAMVDRELMEALYVMLRVANEPPKHGFMKPLATAPGFGKTEGW